MDDDLLFKILCSTYFSLAAAGIAAVLYWKARS